MSDEYLKKKKKNFSEPVNVGKLLLNETQILYRNSIKFNLLQLKSEAFVSN